MTPPDAGGYTQTDATTQDDQPTATLEETQQEAIQARMEQVSQTLDLLFQAAEKEEAVWLKAKNARALASWIIDLQNVASLLEQQVEALKAEVADRPAKKIWTPGL